MSSDIISISHPALLTDSQIANRLVAMCVMRSLVLIDTHKTEYNKKKLKDYEREHEQKRFSQRFDQRSDQRSDQTFMPGGNGFILRNVQFTPKPDDPDTVELNFNSDDCQDHDSRDGHEDIDGSDGSGGSDEEEDSHPYITSRLGMIHILMSMSPAISARIRTIYLNNNPMADLKDVPTPLSDQHKALLTRCKFSDITPEKLSRTSIDTSCAVCQLGFEAEQQLTLLPCLGRHYFHNDCLDPWFSISKKCPVCRENIEDTLKSKI